MAKGAYTSRKKIRIVKRKKPRVGAITVTDIDVEDFWRAREDGDKYGVTVKLESSRGPSGWPVVSAYGYVINVKRLLGMWGYEDEFDKELGIYNK
jgi:hypothetical protein